MCHPEKKMKLVLPKPCWAPVATGHEQLENWKLESCCCCYSIGQVAV